MCNRYHVGTGRITFRFGGAKHNAVHKPIKVIAVVTSAHLHPYRHDSNALRIKNKATPPARDVQLDCRIGLRVPTKRMPQRQ
jgi:hypothetical protein